MTATVPQLGARVLRRLGLALVANADRPAAGPTVPAETVAARALRGFGIPTAEAERPALTVTVAQAEIAARALRLVGANPYDAAHAASADGSPVPMSELKRRVVARLGVSGADSVTAVADLTEVENKITAAHEMLAARYEVPWLRDAVPHRAAEQYVVMGASLSAPYFGKPADPAAFAGAMESVRLLAFSGVWAQDMAERKVEAVQDSLVAAGLAAWAITAIPRAHAEDYAHLAAAALAPIYGKVPDPAWTAGPEARLQRAGIVRGAQARAEAAVRSAVAELAAQGLSGWDADAIPAAGAEALELLATQAVAPDFGKATDPEAQAAATLRLRRQVLAGPAGQAMAEEQVRGVHAELEARGRARWMLADLPAAAEEPYVVLAAYRMAPIAGQPQNPLDFTWAERVLAQVTALPTAGRPVVAEYF